MPNFKPETLQTIKKLYLQYLGYIPSLIENANEEMQALKDGKFLRESSLSEKLQESSLSTSFINFLRIVSAGVNLITDNDHYCTPVHLVLKEFLAWANSFEKEDFFQEVADVEARFTLYKALFLSESNLMEISPDNIDKFNLGIVGCETVISSAKEELDIFAVHPLLNNEVTKLNLAFKNFNEQCLRDNHEPLVMNNLDRETECLNGYFTELSKVFETTKSKGWLLEQQRQDMRVHSELILVQINRVKEAVKTIINNAENNPQLLINLIEAKGFSAKITNFFTKISIGIDAIKWRIGTDVGRIQGIRQHAGLTGCWGLNNHQRQNSLGIVDEENVEQGIAFSNQLS
ncbi:MAG: hypothetical protein Q8M03_11495 [Legionella sp.]|nr:hypothetical protein [Legionella sp.]